MYVAIIDRFLFVFVFGLNDAAGLRAHKKATNKAKMYYGILHYRLR